MSCLETLIGVGSVVVWSDMQAAIESRDPFQVFGISAAYAPFSAARLIRAWECDVPADELHDEEDGYEP